MLAITLILIEVVIWLSLRFLVKNEKLHKILRGCTWIVLVIWAVHYGIRDFARFDVLSFILILPVTYAVYLLSLYIVGTKFTKTNLLPFEVFKAKGKLGTSLKRESLRNLYSASYEELSYRWFLQNALYELTRSVVVSIVVAALVFGAVHISKKKAIVQHIDIFTFSIVITIWFYFTANPIYSSLIHILRNQLVICQKYTLLKEEQERTLKYLKIMHERMIPKND